MLNSVRGSHCDKVTFEQRPEGREEGVMLTSGRDCRGRVSEGGTDAVGMRSSGEEALKLEQSEHRKESARG